MTDPNETPDDTLDDVELCASCGRLLGWDGLPPARDGNAWICGECDAANNFDALDLLD